MSAELTDVQTNKDKWVEVERALQEKLNTPKAVKWSIHRAIAAIRLRAIMWIMVTLTLIMVLCTVSGFFYEIT